MTPEQIADHLVEMGIGQVFGDFGVFRYRIGDSDLLTSTEFIQDWRTAGKCLEAILKDEGNRRIVMTDRVVDDFAVSITWYYGSNDGPKHTVHGDNLPQAICTAYCEATSD